jgi:uncharacterized cupredoxin-like copper-binding protein
MNDMTTTDGSTTVAPSSRRRRVRGKWAGAGAAAAVALALSVTVLPGGGQIEITANEYSFQDVPRGLSAGEHRFQLKNDGDEAHEMVIIRLKEGVGSVDEVLALPEEEAMANVDVVGVAQAAPGEKSATVRAKLQAGEYALVCFIPTAGSGAPHFAHGMTAAFSVQ